jgi:tight adherence protein C
MLIPALFFTLMFATLAVLGWSGYALVRSRGDPLEARLEELQAHAMSRTGRAARRRGGGVLNGFLYLLSLLPGVEQWLRESEQELAHAGVRHKPALALYVLFHLAFLAAAVAGMWTVQKDAALGQKIGAMASAVLLGWLLPQQVLHYLVRRYRRKLQDALPDTVDLLGIVLGTGLALDQAMLRVCEETDYIYPELAAELSTVVMQVRAGQERAKAFDQLVKRTGVEDIKSLAAMIVQSERFGTSLAQALSVYAESLRTRRRLRAETAVARAGIKMLFPVVVFILPALFVVTLVPIVLNFLNSLRGGLGPGR